MSSAPAGRLRVGIPPVVTTYPPATGVGRMWSRVLAELRRRGDRIVVGPPSAAIEVDVWLSDGHQGPLDVTGPCVTQLHEAPWSDPAQAAWLDPAFVARHRPLSDAAAAAATAIVTPSHASRDEIVRAHGVPPERVHVAHHGVDHAVFHPGARTGRWGGVRRARPHGPFVLFASTVHPRKNLDAVRAAVAGLAARGLPHHLVLVLAPAPDRADGATAWQEATAELPGAPGRIHAVRGISDRDLAGLMAAADAICAPSHGEGFGLTVAEAMACGTVPVVSERGALPEVVGDAGLITGTAPAAVEDALGRVLTDAPLRRRLAAAAVERASAFTWSATADRWDEAIRSAVAGTGRA